MMNFESAPSPIEFSKVQDGGAYGIRRRSEGVYRAVVIAWVTLSVVSLMLTSENWLQLHRKLRSSAATVRLQNEADGVLRLVLEAETAQRGYTISGAESFLQAFEEAAGRLAAQFDRLVEISRLDSTVLNHVVELRARTEVLMEDQRRTITLRRQKGLAAVSEAIRSSEPRALMEDVRKRVGEIKSLRASLSSPESRESRDQLVRAGVTSLVAGALGIGAGVIALSLAQVALRQRERERELLEAKLHAEHENQEKSIFLANVSHEIRTPMNAILGFSELLASELQQPKHREYLRLIRTSANSLLQLINDILDMSKVEAGAFKLRLEPTDPREICGFVTTVFAETAAAKGLALECQVQEDLPRALLVDRGRMRQILVNLVGNAIKFTDRGRVRIAVGCENQRDAGNQVTLIIEVEDTGVGIPQDQLQAVFKPFVQAGRHREKEKAGFGLGLAIVNHLTQLMGGSVTVASLLGQGSSFHLRFPDVAVSARLPTVEGAEQGDGPLDFNELRPARILIVDDNEMNCRLVGGMFDRSHHRLDYGVDGREAVEMAGRLRPDVVLLDVRMPNMDGAAAAAEIHKLPGLEMLPIIALSASNGNGENPTGEGHFAGSLSKPFTRRELFDQLAQFVPRIIASAGESTASVATDGDAEDDSTVGWGNLAGQLRVLEVDPWPGLRDSLAVNESRAFAARLKALAGEAGCKPLLAYADELAQNADSYAVDALEQNLLRFPAVVAGIEQSSNSDRTT